MDDIRDIEETEKFGGKRGLARDWTKESITRNLLSMGWPMSVNAILTMTSPTIDLIWVGRVGEASLERTLRHKEILGVYPTSQLR